MESDDWKDIAATLDGDGEAYARLISRYQTQIGNRMWRFTRDRNLWEELVQDVFVEAYTSLARFKGTAPFEHWLNRIATRVGYRFWRDRKRSQGTTSLGHGRDQESASIAPAEQMNELTPYQAAEMVHAQLAQLPPRDRLVLTMMYLEQASVAEIADHTGWTKSMVKVQAFRARKKLRKLLEGLDEHQDRHH